MTKAEGTTTSELDALSLEQALRDFDTANARTVELAQRVVRLASELRERDAEILRLRTEVGQARAEVHAIHATRAFRLAQRYWQAKEALGR